MPYTIEYGPEGSRITMPGVKLVQVVPNAEALIAAGATELCIVDRAGIASNLAQFKLDYQRLIIDA